MSTLKKFLNSPYSFIFALILGMTLAVSASVWATSVGTDVTVTGVLSVSSATASSTVTRALGVGTSTPAVIFSVGGATGNTTGHGYFTGGLGVGAITTTSGRILANVDLGIATTTPAQQLSVVGNAYFTSGLGVGIATTSAGTIENTGNVLFGDASGDLVMSNAAVWVRNNAGTTTIPSASAVSFAYATTTSGAFVRFDTTNTRIGIASSSPGATLAVGGDGYVVIGGNGTSTLSIQSTTASARGGCIELLSPANGVMRLYATTTGTPAVWEAGSCR